MGKKKGLQVLENYNTKEIKIHCHITITELTCNIPNRNLQYNATEMYECYMTHYISKKLILQHFIIPFKIGFSLTDG